MSQEDNTNFSTKLAAYVAALRPIIYINHFDSHSVDSLIASIAEKGTKIYMNIMKPDIMSISYIRFRLARYPAMIT